MERTSLRSAAQATDSTWRGMESKQARSEGARTPPDAESAHEGKDQGRV